ncbi:Uncharacterised protein [Mycobacteroides abscessus subsp. abscessus]|nr:hypothetical protein [Mycobacteroides abscessus]SIK16245.1 Uncharacterised protein [Mycobacteroides abscessus subsp. abscessus]SLC56069.1 Uncharacterised protein [Mycobacteroides abscessus subsp. massiliense]OTR18087.1 hypothetical protein B9M82_02700 [Mycobacteroides abscessus]SIL54871.1 Uncharacterised protein [Mycobacteroides abscessus subsp. abscessus]
MLLCDRLLLLLAISLVWYGLAACRRRKLRWRLLSVPLIRRSTRGLLAVTGRLRELAGLAVLRADRGPLSVPLIGRGCRLLAVLLRRDRRRRLLTVPLIQLRTRGLLNLPRSWRELARLAVLLSRGLILRLVSGKLGRQWGWCGAGVHLALGIRYRLRVTLRREIALPVRSLAFCELLGGEIW